MQNTSKKRMSIVKKILLAVAAIPVLFILYLVISSLLSPVFDNIDKNRFEELDKQSRSLYETVKEKSAGTENWTYEARCDDILAGPWPTGQFICSTVFKTEVLVTSVGQLNALHEKYHPIINTSTNLKQVTQLSRQLPGQFGVDFVVSSAEQEYVSTGNKSVECTYLLQLGQPEEPASVSYREDYGSPIATNTGRAYITVDCSDIARDNWYGPPNNY